MRAFLYAPAVALFLAGCTGPSIDAPSLLPRAIEARSDAEVRAPPAPVAVDASLDAEITRRSKAFDAAADAYDVAIPAIERRLGGTRGAAEGSGRWLAAQTAVGDLGEARSAVDSALGRLEELAIARAAANDPPYPVLDAALTAARTRFDAAATTDARLRAIVPD